MIEKLLNYFGYVKKSKQYLQQTNIIKNFEPQTFITNEKINICYKCGGNAIYNIGKSNKDKLCNKCLDKKLGLD